jgi:anti-sigma B factor antagonist
VSEVVVPLSGEIDVSTVPQVRTAVGEAIADHPGEMLTVDLSDVSFLDSTGIGALISALKRARSTDGDIRLVGVRSHVFKVFQLTGLTKVLEIEPYEESAHVQGGR